jgi:hypothetical protein
MRVAIHEAGDMANGSDFRCTLSGSAADRRLEVPRPGCSTGRRSAVVSRILTAIYEEDFLGFSYGFRPGRGAHDALDARDYQQEGE